MDASTKNDQMERFSDSMSNFLKLNLEQIQAVLDEISIRQPNLLNEIAGLRCLGVPEEKIEHIINLLIILYDYFCYGGKIELPVVTGRMIEEAKANINASLEWAGKEDPEEYKKLFKKGIIAYPERYAFAFMTHHMIVCGFNRDCPGNEQCLMTAKVILDCFVRVKKEKSIADSCVKL